MSRQRANASATAALLAVVASLVVSQAPLAQPLLPLSAFPRERIVVETPSARRHTFEAWRAESTPMRAQGLMFVKSLRPDQSMIFVYAPPQVVGMWMKNTLIALDMLFVDDAGCVVKVHERARPGDLTTISSDDPVVLVVELAGGTVATLGLAAGDRVVRPDAGWPDPARPCTRSR